MSNPSPTAPFVDVRMRGFRARTHVADAVEILQHRVARLGAESIAVDGATGRVLTETVVAAVAVPHFDRAAFDGYAVRAAETHGARAGVPVSLRLAGEALPGRPFRGELPHGCAVRIMTGAPMPPGADAVMPFEWAAESGAVVAVTRDIDMHRHVGRIGEDVPIGREVLRAGRTLRPQDLGLLSSIGVGRVDVVRQPRVAIVTTGDEVLPPGAHPRGYQIVDSNSVVLRAQCARDGGQPLPTQHLADSIEQMRAVLATDTWDILLMSGGTSVGREDYAPQLLAELGELPVHGLALRPGGPAAIGFIGKRPVFLLPGNPVACLCAYDLLAGRAVRLLGGRSGELPYRRVERLVAGPIHGAADRLDYVRVVDGAQGVEAVKSSGASILSSTVVADGFVLVPPGREGYAPGERVDVYLYD